MTMALIPEMSEDCFERDVVNAPVPVLVDFHAQWCAPCKAMAPALDDVARDYDGAAVIVKVDIDAQPGLAKAFGVRSVPTLVLLCKGIEKERMVGSTTRSKLAAMIDRHLDAANG
jgi:thioredoxin 1